MTATYRIPVFFLCVLLIALLGKCRSKRAFVTPSTAKPFSSWKSWKTWGDFNNSANWGGGHIPCSGDRVVFPRTLKVMAYFGSEPTGTWNSDEPVRIRELQLPHHGVIVFPWDGQIFFMGESGRTKDCPGTDVLFTSRENVWLDPWNWEDPSVPAEEADAVPHLRRIPCGQDVAFFQQRFFRILLPDFSVRTGALYIFDAPVVWRLYYLKDKNTGCPWCKCAPWVGRTRWIDQKMRNRALEVLRQGFSPTAQKFLRSTWTYVKLYFVSNLISPWPESEGSPLYLADSEEALGGKDQCGLGVEGTEEETQQLMDGVCRNVMCPRLDCTQPVRPHLHCCHICGAVVELQWPGHSPSPDIHAVKHVVRQAVEDAGLDATSTKSAIAVHTSLVPTHHSLLQVVILQRTLDGQEAQSAAAAVVERLHGWSGYGVARLRASGGPIQRATLTSVLVTLFLPLLAAVAAMAAILFYLGEVRSFREFGRQLDAVVFARFENVAGTDDNEDRVHVEIDKPPAPPSPPPKVRSARGSWTASPRQFQNPLFQEAHLRSDETALTDFSSPPDGENKSVTHANPLYAELLKREKELESTLGSDTPERSDGSPSSTDSVDSSPLVEIDL